MSSQMTTTLIAVEEDDAQALHESGLTDVRLMSSLWAFVKPHWKALLLSLLLLPFVAGTEILQPFIVRHVIDGPVRAGDFQGLIIGSLGFLLLLLVQFIFRYWQMTLTQITGEKIIYDLRTALYAHLQKLSPHFYHRTPIGKLVTRITNDVENLSEMFSSGGIAILADLAIIIGALVGMFIMEWRLALVVSVVMPVLVITMEYFRRKSRYAYDMIRVKVAQINAFLQENLTGMAIVQLFRRQERNYAEFNVVNSSNLKINLSSVYYDSALSAVIEFLTNIALVAVLWYGGQAITQGDITFGLLVAFFQFVQMMFRPIEDVTDKYTIIQSGLASVDKIMVLLNQPLDLPVQSGEAVIPEKPRGIVEFRNVRFGYKVDNPVIRDISFAVSPGQMLALVGPSGSGKSTILKLINRFYDVQDGAIFLDSVDLRNYPLDVLRKRIVMFQQDDFLFSRTIAENIALDEPEFIDKARLNRAVDDMNLRSVVDRLPDGLNTLLEEQGKNVSSGEKQLILFARAIYHDPTVLILDEATSAIDPQTEYLVQAALERLMQGRTVLVVAHRLSTIRNADNILVLEKGRIIESGPHEELLAKNGLYAQFVQYQEMAHP